MNYRHAYHAGNHGDVVKHAVLARILDRLKAKDKPFRVLDTHAGAGLYALDGPEAGRTGEWRDGVGKLREPLDDGAAEALLAPLRAAVAGVNGERVPLRYPGSPELIRFLLRPDDRLILNELHPEERKVAEDLVRFDRRIVVTGLDAAVAIKAHLPPPQRRGLVLIDPPYERPDEAEANVLALKEGLRRFATGVFLLWYPITGDGLDRRVFDLAGALGLPHALRAEVRVRAPRLDGGLAGSGLLIVNPPWRLDEELLVLLPALARRLAQDSQAGASVEFQESRPRIGQKTL